MLLVRMLLMVRGGRRKRKKRQPRKRYQTILFPRRLPKVNTTNSWKRLRWKKGCLTWSRKRIKFIWRFRKNWWVAISWSVLVFLPPAVRGKLIREPLIERRCWLRSRAMRIKCTCISPICTTCASPLRKCTKLIKDIVILLFGSRLRSRWCRKIHPVAWLMPPRYFYHR